MWSLKSLPKFKWESRTSLHAVQYKRQPGSFLMFYSCYFKNGDPRHFVLLFCGRASLALFLTCSRFFCYNQGFCSHKIVVIEKRGYFKLISIVAVQNVWE